MCSYFFHQDDHLIIQSVISYPSRGSQNCRWRTTVTERGNQESHESHKQVSLYWTRTGKVGSMDAYWWTQAESLGNSLPCSSKISKKSVSNYNSTTFSSLVWELRVQSVNKNLAREYFDASSLNRVPLEQEVHMISHLEAHAFLVSRQILSRSPNYSIEKSVCFFYNHELCCLGNDFLPINPYPLIY
ncbi:hypothetical protein P879_08692 [Paragonimus westermani]|uniref:Uncharacterized protein n=1 Tax=Paragonimus westermani TaxID=34504 RepID=A0A8T0D3M8_9TREM|nr:hypothetical protein P879_08692 [Paragonimus westermani]